LTLIPSAAQSVLQHLFLLFPANIFRLRPSIDDGSLGFDSPYLLVVRPFGLFERRLRPGDCTLAAFLLPCPRRVPLKSNRPIARRFTRGLIGGAMPTDHGECERGVRGQTF
jgi:hypothetical protein